MGEETLTNTLLRQYLLRRVDDDERQRIEKLFLTDSQARDRVLAAEQELIEDYLENNLTTEDKKIFISQYARTPEQQRKLRINKSIKHWAVTETQATTIFSSIWNRILQPLRLRPAYAVPIAVTILIAIVIAYVWLNHRMEYWAIQKEVAQLNTPASLSQNLPQTVSLRLAPVTARSGEAQNKVTKRGDIRFVELYLLALQKERYPTYQAVLLRIGETEPVVTVDVEVENDKPIRLILPVHRLTGGSYRIRLSGIATDGTKGPAEEYTFSVD
jgi:hypothetical protein